MLFGAHVSIAGGVFNAPGNAAALGCEVFQMFTRSPHGGNVPQLTPAVVKQFLAAMKEHGQKACYVHAPYFINFASKNPRIKHGSISVIRQELERASQLQAKYVMVHLGSMKDLGQEKGFAQLIEGLDRVLAGYKGSAELLIENTAGAGEIIGDTFEELAEIIFHKDLNKYRLGVCFDTQHAFGSGYDFRTPELADAMLTKFDALIGLDRFKLVQCNDSKVELSSRRDRHEHFGRGHIGVEGFRNLIGDQRLKNVDFVLETPHDAVIEDLNILKKLRG